MVIVTPLEPQLPQSHPSTQGTATPIGQKELARVDCGGLIRAISLLENDVLQKDAIISLLKHELDQVQKQSDSLFAFAHQTCIELRQIREERPSTSGREPTEGVRSIQDGNDAFVAQLISEHEAQVRALRRERDIAVDRVRELSRGLSRIGGLSTPSLRRISTSNLPAVSPNDNEVSLLRARVDELLFERDRSLKLLRQLAEQRDQAESRLHVVVSSSPPSMDPSEEPSDRIARELLEKAPIANWEVASPEEHPAAISPESHPTVPKSLDAETGSISVQSSPESTLPLLRKKPGLGSEGAGSYSISARELPTEEVVVVRPRPAPSPSKP
jgi:hypothetical protein